MQAPDRISLVLRAPEGKTLEQAHQFVGTGLLGAIGRGLGVLEGHCEGDAIERASTAIRDLGQERELRSAELELWQAALAVDPLLTACAPEMFSLLERIELKCGGLNAVLGHGMEPSEQMREDSRQALDDVWPMLCKAQGKEHSVDPVDKRQVNQSNQEGENVNQEDPENFPGPAFNIDDHVRMDADARRYRWLRDVAFDTPRQDLVPRDRHQNLLIEKDLDSEIDCAMHAYPGDQKAEPCA